LDPIAPWYSDTVDFKKTKVQLPPWRKVREIVSIDCLEKVHADPTYVCNETAYKNFTAVKPEPTEPPTASDKENKALKRQVRHLKAQVDHLTSPCIDRKQAARTILHPGFETTGNTMTKAASWQEKVTPHSNAEGADPVQISIDPFEASKQKLTTAQGVAEKQSTKLAR